MDKFIIRKSPSNIKTNEKDEKDEKDETNSIKSENTTKRINMSLFNKFDTSSSKTRSDTTSSTKTIKSSIPIELNEPLQIPDRYRKTLSSEQIKALEFVCERKSVFISGPGGTGKSHWIKACKSIFIREQSIYAGMCPYRVCGNFARLWSNYGS